MIQPFSVPGWFSLKTFRGKTIGSSETDNMAVCRRQMGCNRVNCNNGYELRKMFPEEGDGDCCDADLLAKFSLSAARPDQAKLEA